MSLDARVLHAALAAADASVPLAVAERLTPHWSRRLLPKDAELLSQGAPWRHALLLEEGLLRLYFLRRDGRAFNKNFYTAPALLCPLTVSMWEAPLLFGIASVRASTVWACDGERFRAALANAGCWDRIRTALLARLLDAKLQREHDLLALDGRQRYEALCRRAPEVAEQVPLHHLASYLGMTDVSLSRIRRQARP